MSTRSPLTSLRTLILIALTTLVLLPACGGVLGDPDADPGPQDAYTVRGQVVHVELEAGFWGIQTNDGRNLDPVGELPENVRKDGLLVQARVRDLGDAASIHMWGTPVQVLEISPIEQ